jgi:hypothetical protein
MRRYYRKKSPQEVEFLRAAPVVAFLGGREGKESNESADPAYATAMPLKLVRAASRR